MLQQGNNAFLLNDICVEPETAPEEAGDADQKKKWMSKEALRQLNKITTQHIQSSHADRNRKKEEDERRKRREEFKRKERLLDASFDGDIDEINKIFEEIDHASSTEGLAKIGIDAILRKCNKIRILECEDSNGNTPISEAAGGGQVEAIKLLREHGALINQKGQCNRTPLYRAAFLGHTEAVKVLLELGGDPRITSNDVQTPLQVAANDEIKKIIKSWNITQTENMLVKDEDEKKIRQAEDKMKRAYEIQQSEEQARQLERQLRAQQRELEEKRKAPQYGQGYNWYQQNNNTDDDENTPGERVSIQKLEDFVIGDEESKIEESGKWPLIIDPSQKAATLLRYRNNFYLNALSDRTMGKERIRMAVLGALRFGKGVVLDLMGADMFERCEERFDEVMEGFMKNILNKSVMDKRIYQTMVRETDGDDYLLKKFKPMRVNNFRFYVITQTLVPPQALLEKTYPIRIVT